MSGEFILGKKGEGSHLSYAKGRESWAEPEVTFPDPSRRFFSLSRPIIVPSPAIGSALSIHLFLFFTWIFFFSLLFIDLESGSIEIFQRIYLSIDRSRSLSSSRSISKYGRTLEACPRRRCPLGERKGAAILFLSSIVPIISLIPFCLFVWGPGLVRFLLLSTQFSVFVRDHLRRKDRYKFFGGAAVKGRFPLFH